MRIGASAADTDAASAMIPRAAAAHRAALLARWLAATPCAGVAAAAASPGPAPPLAVAVLPLYASSPSSLEAAGRGAGAASFSSRRGSAAAALTAAGAQLATDLVLGVASPSSFSSSSFSTAATYGATAYRRAVEIGAELYAGGELVALGSLLQAARAAAPSDALDPSHDAPALLFLQALRASANIAATAMEDAAKGGNLGGPTVSEALGLFFRAASGIPDAARARTLCSAGSLAGSGGNSLVGGGGADPLLQHLIKLLRGIMSGFPAAIAAAEDDAGAGLPLSRLEYYETLMLFFERLGCSAGAMQCAHAALYEVDGGVELEQQGQGREEEGGEGMTTPMQPTGGAGTDEEATDAGAEQRRRQRAARLWANLLQYALDLGQWRGAYATVLSVPGAEAQCAALRRLVAALCEPGDARGGAAALVSLPFGDRLPTVVRALEGRAAAAPLDVIPNPALMLHALHMSRGCPQNAAGAILRHARQLGGTAVAVAVELSGGGSGGSLGSHWPVTPGRASGGGGGGKGVDAGVRLVAALEAHVGALLAAINALRLCPPGKRFVVEEWQLKMQLHRRGGGAAGAGAAGLERMLSSARAASGVERNDDVSDEDDTAMGEASDGNGHGDMGMHDDEDTDAVMGDDARAGAGISGGAGVREKIPPHPKRRRRGMLPPPIEATTLAQLLREYALAAARLELVVAGAEVATLGLGPSASAPVEQLPGLITSLVCYGLFTAATTLACAWAEGEALTKLVVVIAATLAARAALAQMRQGSGRGGSAGGSALGAAAGAAAAAVEAAIAAATAEEAAAAAAAATDGTYGGTHVSATASSRGGSSALSSGGGLLGSDAAAAEASPPAAWAALRAFLERHDTPERNFRPAEAAARAILATGAGLRLPQWLTAKFTSGRGTPGSSGMARRGANPTALLTVYLQHGRLEEAARLALAELRSYAASASAISRTRLSSSWFPEPLLRHACDRLLEVGALDGLRVELEGALDEHRRRAEADSRKLASFSH